MNVLFPGAAIAAALVAGVAGADVPIPSQTGRYFEPAAQNETAAMRLDGAPARMLTLSEPTAKERLEAKAAATSDKRMPLQIGFARAVPSAAATIDLATLEWTTLADGTRVARIGVESPGAAGLRLELDTIAAPASLVLRFAGTAQPQRVFGTTAGALAFAQRWSPVLEGSGAIIEIERGPAVSVANARLLIPRVSHLDIAGADLASSRLKRVPDIGSSGACNVDVACVAQPSAELLQAEASVAQIVFTMSSGGTFLCTGSLLASSDASGQPTQLPYFVTAHHCIGDAATAASMNFLWFFQAATCNSRSVPAFSQTAGGGTLLYTSYDVDLSFLRLNTPPPAGSFLGGWDAGPVFPQSGVVSLHHPSGDLMKYTAGQSVDYAHDFDDVQQPGNFVPQGSYLRIRWSQGTTEPGSSGGGVYTRDATGAYKLRGVLHGGDASCSDPTGLDYFARFDLAYPAISQFLAGVTQPAAGNNAIEYYNVDLDHYFMTSFADETASVESGGAGRGWVRTGYAFPIQATKAAAAAVCRFYGNPAIDPATGSRRGPNSHFYTADPGECAQVKLDPGWVYEAIAFDVDVPSAGACPAGTTPILRAYNNGFANNNSNHRYTTSQTIYQFMQTQRWTGENIVMCAP